MYLNFFVTYVLDLYSTRVTWSYGLSCAPQSSRYFETRVVYTPLRGAQTDQNPYSAAFVVLSCVPMGIS
jgi:hypothetical protein